MKRVLSSIHQLLSIVTLIAVIGEFLFAGMGVFHATGFEIHRVTGVLLWAVSALLLLLALVGTTGRRTIGFSALLFVLMFVQPLLLRTNEPFVEALHPVNGLAIVAVTAYLVRLGTIRGKT